MASARLRVAVLVAACALAVSVPGVSAESQAVAVPASGGAPVVVECAPDNTYEPMSVQADGTLFFPNDGCQAAYNDTALGLPPGTGLLVTRLDYKVTGHNGTICGWFAFSGRALGRSALECSDASTPFVSAPARTSPGDPGDALLVTWHPTSWEHDNAYLCSLTVLSDPPSTAQAGDCGFPQPEGQCLPGLWAQANADGTVTLTWPPVQDPNVTGYQVLLEPLGGNWFPVTPQVPPASAAWTDSGAVAGTTYAYAVVAMAGSVQLGSFCPAYALAGSAPLLPCPTVLVTVEADGGIRLLWTAVAGADGYNVYGPTHDGALDFMGHVTATTFLDAHPLAELPHTYSVHATNGGPDDQQCPTVTASATAHVPYFPSAWALGAAVAGLAGASVLLVRRRT